MDKPLLVPFRSPHSRQPLRWAAPPRPGQIGAIASPPASALVSGAPIVASLSTSSFGSRSTGIVGAAYPTLIRIATLGFTFPVYIMSVTLASSIVNASTTDVAMLVVHKDVGNNLNVTSGDEYFAEHVVEQGLSHSQRTGTSYGENIAPYFGASDSIGLYALALSAACAVSGIVSIRYLSQA